MSAAPIHSLTFDSLADLRASEHLFEGEIVVVLGVESKGDSDGLLYRYSESSTADDNEGSVIQPTIITGAGRWLHLL
jgi:hypothetical protein